MLAESLTWPDHSAINADLAELSPTHKLANKIKMIRRANSLTLEKANLSIKGSQKG